MDESLIRQVRESLQARAADSTPGPPPLTSITDSPRAANRHRWLVPVSAAAAVAVFVGAVAVGAQLGSSSDNDREGVIADSSTGDATSSTLSPSATETPSTSSAPPPPGRFPSAAECAPFVPAELPSGAAPGEGRPSTSFPSGTEWGSGGDLVVVLLGQEAADDHGGGDAFPGIGDPVQIAEGERTVVWVGDPPASAASIKFLNGDCPVVVYVGLGDDVSFPDPFDYAARL